MGNTIETILQVLNNKALGGTITNNSDSIILADNNNYILDFKGRQYGLPTVRYANGGHLFGDGGTTAGPEVIITPDEEYNRFLNTLPDNQRLTPNEDYDTYLYWKLNRKPKNFQEALDRGMYVWDDSDHSYHGNSIAWGDDGTGYFIKPKHHDTLKYELDWFNKNIITEPGGHQRFETPEERAESDRFRENYILADDPDRPDFYIYKPKDQAEGLNTYERLNDISIKEKALGGHLFGNGGDGRTTLPRIGDSWRNTETGESGTVVGYAPDVPYMGEDGKLYPTTSPVVKYDSGETLFGVIPQYTLPEVEALGHLSTPADDLDTVIADMATAGIASTERMASDQLKEGINNGNWRDIVNGAATAFSPLAIPAGPLRPYATTLFGADRLFVDPNGIQKTGRELLNGNYWNAAKSFAGDVFNGAVAGAGMYGMADDALNLAARLGSTDAKSIQFARALNGDIKGTGLKIGEPIGGITRTKLGDVEINNPNLFYRLDGGNHRGAFSKQGAYIEDNLLYPGPPKISNDVGYTWWSKGSPYTYSEKKPWTPYEDINEGNIPSSRLIVTSEGETPSLLHVQSQNYRIGQWNGKKGLVGPREYVTPEPVKISDNVYTWEPGYGYRQMEEEYVPTSWRFYERGPARISEAERVGIPKGERGMLTDNEKQALEDLSLYRNSGQYRLRFMVDNLENPYWGGINSEGVNFVQFATDLNFPFKYDNFRVNYSTDTGLGVLSYNPNRNMAGYSSRMFTAPSGLKWAPGEANMFINGDNESKIILTAPKTDALGLFLGDKPASEVIPEEELSSTIDKAIMKDFWTKVRQVQRPGTYLSGDNGRAPKGSDLILAFKKKQLHKADFKERPLKELFVTRDGVSPDAFSSIVRQGLRDGSLRWGEGFAKWNNSAVLNRGMYEAWQLYMKDLITALEYENIYNKWMESLGANKPLQWIKIGNREYPIHPHPYIYLKDLGGSLNILKV